MQTNTKKNDCEKNNHNFVLAPSLPSYLSHRFKQCQPKRDRSRAAQPGVIRCKTLDIFHKNPKKVIQLSSKNGLYAPTQEVVCVKNIHEIIPCKNI